MMLYAGPLTRYYAHLWNGASPADSEQPPVDEVRRLLIQWRDMVAEVAETEFGTTAYWEESADGVYAFARPDWEGWYALLLWALYRDFGLPVQKLTKGWLNHIEELPVFQLATERPCRRYPTLAANCELFLPMEADELLWGPDPSGQPDVPMGAVPALLRELEALNADSWQASDETIAGWETRTAAPDELEALAQRGFATLWRMARFAVEKQVPIRLDYDGE